MSELKRALLVAAGALFFCVACTELNEIFCEQQDNWKEHEVFKKDEK